MYLVLIESKLQSNITIGSFTNDQLSTSTDSSYIDSFFNLSTTATFFRRPHGSKNIRKKHVWHLLVNFALFESHHTNTLFWAQEIDFEKFSTYFSSFVAQWIHFRGDGALPKITKIHLPKILNLVHFVKKYFFAR